MGWKAALVALGYDRDRRLTQIFKSGLSRARSLGASGRVKLLEALRDGGAGAFADPLLHRPWLHLAAPGQGGLLTAADFTSVPDLDRAALRLAKDEGVDLRIPWEAESSEAPELGLIAALDPGGFAAILCYEQPTGGVELPGWDLVAATLAAPVRRGQPRVKPGTALPSAAPIRLEFDASSRVVAAVAEVPGRAAFRVGL
jgi:gamma-glutamyltranspeptidase/glutathione hydrolase